MINNISEFTDDITSVANAVATTLDGLLPSYAGADVRLSDAVRYGVFSGGKRLRPYLTVNTAQVYGVEESRALRVAAAVECIHSSSLIHDDLPGVDNDDFRHHKPTVHRQFDVASALFAGNVLNSLPARILASGQTHPDPVVRLELIQLLSDTVIAIQRGQTMDMSDERSTFNRAQLEDMQKLKTGELLSCAVEAGAILGRAPESERKALRAFALDFGQANQIVNDLLDVHETFESTGKSMKQDAKNGKATLITLKGEKAAYLEAEIFLNSAIGHLDIFGGRTEKLAAIAQFVIRKPLEAVVLSQAYNRKNHRSPGEP